MSERDYEDVQLARLWEICDLGRERDEAWQCQEETALQLADALCEADDIRQERDALLAVNRLLREAARAVLEPWTDAEEHNAALVRLRKALEEGNDAE